jgi:hypothetical protein
MPGFHSRVCSTHKRKHSSAMCGLRRRRREIQFELRKIDIHDSRTGRVGTWSGWKSKKSNLNSHAQRMFSPGILSYVCDLRVWTAFEARLLGPYLGVETFERVRRVDNWKFSYRSSQPGSKTRASLEFSSSSSNPPPAIRVRTLGCLWVGVAVYFMIILPPPSFHFRSPSLSQN